MSDIELVISNSKRLESLLEKHFGASGRGLHEKVDSVQRKLPDGVVRRLRFIATIRNKVVHDEGYDRIDDRQGFIDACKSVTTELRTLAGVRDGVGGLVRWIILGAVVVVVAVVIYMLFFRN